MSWCDDSAEIFFSCNIRQWSAVDGGFYLSPKGDEFRLGEKLAPNGLPQAPLDPTNHSFIDTSHPRRILSCKLPLHIVVLAKCCSLLVTDNFSPAVVEDGAGNLELRGVVTQDLRGASSAADESPQAVEERISGHVIHPLQVSSSG